MNMGPDALELLLELPDTRMTIYYLGLQLLIFRFDRLHFNAKFSVRVFIVDSDYQRTSTPLRDLNDHLRQRFRDDLHKYRLIEDHRIQAHCDGVFFGASPNPTPPIVLCL